MGLWEPGEISLLPTVSEWWPAVFLISFLTTLIVGREPREAGEACNFLLPVSSHQSARKESVGIRPIPPVCVPLSWLLQECPWPSGGGHPLPGCSLGVLISAPAGSRGLAGSFLVPSPFASRPLRSWSWAGATQVAGVDGADSGSGGAAYRPGSF